MSKEKRFALVSILLLLFCSILAAGCVSDAILPVTSEIQEMTEYNDIQLKIAADALDVAGFNLGDSVNLSFSNGKICRDIPYVSGYYVSENTNILLVNFNGQLLINKLRVGGLWDLLGLDTANTVTITLNEKQKYATEQKLNSYTISLIRSDYATDEAFSNFRPMNCGNLKENYLYRGASPIDNTENRAHITDALLKKYGIHTILSLNGDQKSILRHQNESNHNSPWFDRLYAEKSVIMSGVTVDVLNKENCIILTNGLRAALSKEGPIYIHCLEGKDRTGFVCILLEALGDATNEEIFRDYFKTYENYYHITKEAEPEVYEQFRALKLDPIINRFTNNGVRSLKEGAIAYLKEGGMTDEEINKFIAKITKA